MSNQDASARSDGAPLSCAPFPPTAIQAAAQAAASAGTALGAFAPGPVGDVGAAVAENAGSAASALGELAGEKPPPNLEVYEHHSPFLFPKWTFANDEAPLMLRQRRRRVSIADGDSGSADSAPGIASSSPIIRQGASTVNTSSRRSST